MSASSNSLEPLAAYVYVLTPVHVLPARSEAVMLNLVFRR